MVQLAIRCLPRVPVAAADIESWLEQELREMRGQLPRSTIRLSRLTQTLPTAEIDIGWLLELELAEGAQRSPIWDRLEPLLSDLRLLGVQPTVLIPRGRYGPSSQHGANGDFAGIDETRDLARQAVAAAERRPESNLVPSINRGGHHDRGR